MEKTAENTQKPWENVHLGSSSLQLCNWSDAPRNVSNSSSWAFEVASAQGSGGFFVTKDRAYSLWGSGVQCQKLDAGSNTGMSKH